MASVSRQDWAEEDHEDEILPESCPLEDSKENGSSSKTGGETENIGTSKPDPLYLPSIALVRCSSAKKSTPTDKRFIFTKEQHAIMKDRFDVSANISREEADLLASRFGSVTGIQIRVWFANMRHQKKKEESRAMKMKSSSTGYPPAATPLVSNGLLKNTPKKKVSRMISDQPGPVSVAVQNTLFEEFRRSPDLKPERKIVLQNKLKTPIPRIEKFFSSLTALIRGRTKEDASKSVTGHSDEFLQEMKKEYHRSRYISTPRRDKLAHQWGVSGQKIADWFSNARLLELLSDRSHSQPPASNLMTCKDETDSVRLPGQLPERLSAHQRHILRKEFKKTHFVSSSKAQDLANELNLTIDRIYTFFRKKLRKSMKMKKSNK